MSDESTAPAGETVSYAVPADAPAAMTVSEAARMLSQARRQSAEPPAESAKPATAEEPELAQANADQPQADPSEVAAEPQPAEEPPIERPRSWAKELDEEWASYPREAQEKIAKREQERDSAIRRSQNEAAEARKALEAKQADAERIRKEYEAKIPDLAKTLESALQNEFADIQSFADVRKMQAEDPFRYQQWDLRQKELALVKAEQQAADERLRTQKQANRATYETEQNKLLRELVPEMADAKKASDLRERAVNMLVDDLGLGNDQLSRWYADDTGHEILSSAGIQKLIADGLKYREMLAAPKAIAAKPLPPVQKPGVAKGGNPSATLNIQNLETQLSKATGNQAIKIAAELTRARRAIAR